MWHKIEIPGNIAERFIGISVPISSKVALISYECVHLLDLSSPFEIFNDNDVPEGGTHYDKDLEILSYKGINYSIVGLYGGISILENQEGEKIVVDTKKECFYIRNIPNEPVFEFRYDDMSGDWFAATFSDDGKYAVLCLPYGLYAFEKLE
ncbi:MAG TPA: hypothetical protein VK436_15935 [Methanocella sp.]|nr:hypothetical protein [Methanocella sp.]